MLSAALLVTALSFAPSTVHRVLAGARCAPPVALERREVLLGAAASSLLLLGPGRAAALVKGSAPPSKMKPKERRCTSIDECEALGEKERAAMAAKQDDSFERTGALRLQPSTAWLQPSTAWLRPSTARGPMPRSPAPPYLCRVEFLLTLGSTDPHRRSRRRPVP